MSYLHLRHVCTQLFDQYAERFDEHLLENAVEDAIAQGKVPKNALSVMQSALDNMEEHYAEDWQEETKDAPECPMF